jgi:RNA methyltransferase, TrmH family
MITSAHNTIIKEVRSLERMRERKNTGWTVLEGFRTLKHAYTNGWQVLNILYVPTKMKAEDWELVNKCKESGARLDEISEPILEKLSRREGPLGVIAIIDWQEKYTLETLPLSKNPFILVAESIEKPGNLGVLIRSASAAGAEAVVLCNSLTAFHEPSCIHSSLGSVFTLPCVTTTTKECLKWLKEKGIIPVVTTPDGKIVYTDHDFTKPSAIIMGNEHSGVSDEFMNNGVTVKIQMHGAMDSLNVSVAGALFLFEAVRQRAAA